MPQPSQPPGARSGVVYIAARWRRPRVTYPGMSRVGHNMIPGPHTRGNIPSFIGASAWEGQCYVISRGRCMEGAVFCHFH
jgi:hypothetical protein